MPFLTIYTPTYQRPSLLAACVASVQAQTVADDIQHLIIRDEVGVGIGGMFAAIADNAPLVHGDYVYILQDDDRLADVEVVRDVRTSTLMLKRPPLLMVRNQKRGQIFPFHWRQRPTLGAVDLGSYIIRADVFQATCQLFGQRYEGDFDYINAVWPLHGGQAGWFDRLVAEAQIVPPGLGRPEAQLVGVVQ